MRGDGRRVVLSPACAQVTVLGWLLRSSLAVWSVLMLRCVRLLPHAEVGSQMVPTSPIPRTAVLAASRSARRRRRPRGERGLSESVQWSILAPLIILLIVGAVESALVLQARACVTQAALAGAEAAAVERGSADAARQAAVNVASVGGLHQVQVAAAEGPGNVHVSVVAHVDLPIDLGFGAVQASAELPREH